MIALLIVMWTTVRHEASHAVAAALSGATVQEVQLFPGLDEELGFYFGFVAHDGTTPFIDAAPFIVDAVLLLVAIALLLRGGEGGRSRLTLFGLIVSPLADLVYGYQGGFWRQGSDVHDLFAAWPDVVVHAAFIAAIGLGWYAARVWRRARQQSTGTQSSDSTSTAVP